MREHDNGRAGGVSLQVLLQPVELLLSDPAQSFELDHVIQTHKVNPFVIETVPARSRSALAEPFQVLAAVVSRDIVLARHIEHLPLAQPLQELVQRIELARLRQMREVARVNQKVRRTLERVNLVHRSLQRPGYIGIRGSVKADMTVADLHEREVLAEAGTPPAKLQTTPVPAHCMHLRKPRRSMPSASGIFLSELV